MARKENVPLLLVEDKRNVNKTLTKLRSREVKILKTPLLFLDIIKLIYRSSDIVRRGTRKVVRIFRLKNDRIESTNRPYVQPNYYRRDLIKNPINVYLPRHLEEKGRKVAAGLGIDDNTKVVTLHMREGGWRKAGENPHVEQASEHRTVNIEAYLPAIDYLFSQGYMIVRIGDATMSPIERNGLIDLATNQSRNDWFELYILMRCEFLIGCDSGPPKVCELLNIPTLVVNVVNTILNYPLRKHSTYILKDVYDKRRGKKLSVKEMINDQDFLTNNNDLSKYSYTDNSSSEIKEATREMISYLEKNTHMSKSQILYKKRLIQSQLNLELKGLKKKWGLENGFLGNGRIGKQFLLNH